MKRYNLTDLEMREAIPGFQGKFIHSELMTLVYWEIKPNSPLDEHSHVHEQIVNVLEGEFELTVEGETQTLTRGSVVVIPANAKHSGVSKTHCKILDAFSPVREDFK